MLRRFIAALIVPAALWAQVTTNEALERLAKDPNDSEAIQHLAGVYDLRVIDAFKNAFDGVKNTEDKNQVAFVLIDYGVKDPKYMDYLIARALLVIDNDPPDRLVRDDNGRGIPGQITPAFEEWCASHKHDVESCTSDYLSPAVTQLAMLGDARAGDTLLHGLRAKTTGIAWTCVAGLSILQRNDALPIIAELIAKLPADERTASAIMLGGFHDPIADALMERYIPNKEMRDRVKQGSGLGFELFLERRKARGLQ